MRVDLETSHGSSLNISAQVTSWWTYTTTNFADLSWANPTQMFTISEILVAGCGGLVVALRESMPRAA